jgi:NAD(P)-dependent dehydrogenase (short-subunit alcohol dehydrogenase family)
MPVSDSAPGLSAQTVLITGAANGLGRALATAFAQAGAKLVLVDFDEQRLQTVAASLPDASAYTADLSDAEATLRMLAQVKADHTVVHTLIHNAGFLVPQPFAEMTDARWNLTFNVGIQAARLLTKAFWEDWLNRGGVAIYVSSRSGLQGSFGESAYSPTKHALEGFAQVLGIEGAEHGIFAHTITPGMYMHTPMSEQNYSPELKTKWVDPIELTPAFLYLALRKDKTLSGKRLSAWDLSEDVRAGRLSLD